MFQDEARFGRINDPKRCWSPKRTRPTVGKQIIREYTYAYGAVSPRDGAADFLILPVMTAVAMKVFLDELARRHDGQYILMIYDGAPCHSPGALNIPDTMTVRTLPPYSPQLNPVENIWDDMREKFFANIVFESMDAVENKISEACLHYEENTETVQSITAFPWKGLSLCIRSHQMLIGLLRSRHGSWTVPGDVRELLDLGKLVSSAVRQAGGPVFGPD